MLPPQSAAPSTAPPKPAKRFSELGISSFIFSLLNVIGVFLDIALFTWVAIRAESSPSPALAAACVLLFFGLLTFSVVGLAVGVAGIFQPDRLRIFSFLGAGMNLIILVSLIIVMFVLILLPGASHLLDAGANF
jgi:hypothetical protein